MTQLPPRRDPIPADCVSLADYERHAVTRMDAGARAYIQGAGADGITRDANLAAWGKLRLTGRAFVEMGGGHTRLKLFGLGLDHPVLFAPCAYHGLVNPGGECETALGAAATGTCMIVSTQAGQSLERVAEIPGPKWFQLYFQMKRDDTLALVRRAEAAGYLALVLTVDAAVSGIRNEEQRLGFALPAGLRAVNLDGLEQPVSRAQSGESPVFRGLLDAAPIWDDLEWLRTQTRLPLLIKGMMHPDDLDRAIDLGVDGLIVSNHGGRVLDTLPATAEILPRIVAQVAGRVPILCDGGIRRGTDVLKALALGATAVLIGRPQLHALAVGGAPGVAHMVTILRAELEVAMALTGCRTLDEIGPGALW